MASQEGHHDVVQTLLGAGAGVNIARSNVSDDVYGLMRVSRDVIRMQWQRATCTINKIAAV